MTNACWAVLYFKSLLDLRNKGSFDSEQEVN